MLLLVCRRYILEQSGNLAISDKDWRFSPHGSTGTHLISLFYSFFIQLPLHCHFFLGGIWEPVQAKLNCAYQSRVYKKYIKILSLCVIKQMQFPLNGVPIVKARTYMIYSWLCLFRGASVENMMERMTALLLKSVWMIESGVVVKWTRENVSWFLSLKFWQYPFFLWFSRGCHSIVSLSGVLCRPYP